MRFESAVLLLVLAAPSTASAAGDVEAELAALRTIVTAQTVAVRRTPLAHVPRLRTPSSLATVPLLDLYREELVVWQPDVPLLVDAPREAPPLVFDEPELDSLPPTLGAVDQWSATTWVAVGTLIAGVGLILTSHALAMIEEGRVGVSQAGSNPVPPWLLGCGVTLSVGAAGLLVLDATRENHVTSAQLRFAQLIER